MKKFKRAVSRKTVFLSVLAGSLLIGIIFYRVFEPIATDNTTVNFSKIAVAQAGAFITKIHDPYAVITKTAILEPVVSSGTPKDFKSEIAKDPYLSKHFEIIAYDNAEIVKSGYGFDYQPYYEKKLEILRRKYDIDNVIAPAVNEYGQILLVSNWLNSRISFGVPHNVSYNFDALDILSRAEHGEKFFCSEYVTTYIQALSSIGITSRFVGLLKGHVVAEVWSNDYDKWVVIDPTFDIFYELNGVPLNALELHNAWVEKSWQRIKIVLNSKNSQINNYPYSLIDYYENFFVRMRNDWFTNRYPRWHPKSNSIMNSIEWSDKYTKDNILVSNEAKRIEDLYWPLNHVHISLLGCQLSADKVIMKLRFNTVTPNFDRFEIKLDKAKAVYYNYNSTFEWELSKGANTFSAASVNRFGLKGRASIISINYK